MRLLISILFLLVACRCFSQSVNFSLNAEQTVKGSSFGLTSGYEFKSYFAFGGFYQTQNPMQKDESWVSNDSFYGVYAQAPLLSSNKLLFSFVLRGGIVNKNFLVVTPSLETRLSVLKNVNLVFGTGYRHGSPSASASLLVQFPR